MKTIRVIFLILALMMTACNPAAGGQGLTIRDAWARPAAIGANSAIYFVINNHGGQADNLLDARCDAAQMAQVHKTETDASGNSMMIHQETVPVPASQEVTFAPGGLHVMLMNLKQNLEPGQKLALTLVFEKAGEVQAEATVREP